MGDTSSLLDRAGSPGRPGQDLVGGGGPDWPVKRKLDPMPPLYIGLTLITMTSFKMGKRSLPLTSLWKNRSTLWGIPPDGGRYASLVPVMTRVLLIAQASSNVGSFMQ